MREKLLGLEAWKCGSFVMIFVLRVFFYLAVEAVEGATRWRVVVSYGVR